MLYLALLNESRPAPILPDTVLALTPFSEWIWKHNYHIWVILQLPLIFWLWRLDRRILLRFLYIGGVLSLLRGICIPLTGLGPPFGMDVNVGLTPTQRNAAWLALVNPISALFGNAPHVYLTKDMFFSGHAATTFLLWLYTRRIPRIGLLALTAHILTVAIVFLSHLHYTIDVVAAWAITFSVYVLFEGWNKKETI